MNVFSLCCVVLFSHGNIIMLVWRERTPLQKVDFHGTFFRWALKPQQNSVRISHYQSTKK